MNTIYEKHRLDHELVRLLVELEFDPKINLKNEDQQNIAQILFSWRIKVLCREIEETRYVAYRSDMSKDSLKHILQTGRNRRK